MSDKKLVKGIVALSKGEYDDYQKSLSSKKEWPGININSDSRMTLNIPMLIMELYRLVPYKEGRYLHFHPFNMPYIKVRKIELVGIVTNVKRNVNNLFLTIEDGTGVTEINYKLEQYLFSLKHRQEIDEKYRNQAGNLRETKMVQNCPKKFPEIRPGFSYPCKTSLQDMAIFENKWWSETDSGLLGKEIQPFDYVYVTGYPCLDTNFQKIPEQITAEFIEHARLTVFAISVTCISEETYNKKLSTWISNTILQRYKEVTRSLCSQGRTVLIHAEHAPNIKSSLCRKYKANCYWVNQVRHIHSTSALWEIKEVVVPAFAESVSEGDVRWEKKVGDQVKEDDVLCEIETDKTSVPVPSPGAGVLKELFVSDGDTVKPGQKLCSIDIGATGGAAAAAEAPKPAAAAPPPPPPPPPPSPKAAAPPSATAPPPPPPEPAATPIPPPAAKPPPPQAPIASMPVAAIKHAQSLEGARVQLPPSDYTREIIGTRTEQRVKMNRMRLRIAERLKDAQNTNAMLTTFNEIDMSRIIEFRKTHQESFTKKYGIKLGFMSPFVAASAYALKDQPVVNAVIDGTDIVYRDYVDISVAVATPKGLVVPVLRSVENKNFAEIEIALAAIGDKARKGKITVEDMDGGTFTISNGGVFGSLLGTPIINPPQSAILGMHGVFDRPIAVKGQVVIRPMMYVALTYDHRLIDGREAVMFLRKIKDAIEDPRIILAGL